jgi:hypothetical protein
VRKIQISPLVIPAPDYPIRGQAAAGTQSSSVVPAKAGIQQDKNAFDLNPLDSRIRGNNEVEV